MDCTISRLLLKRGSNYNVKTMVKTCLNLINAIDFKKRWSSPRVHQEAQFPRAATSGFPPQIPSP